jgi:hypothetical protein
MTFNRQRRCGQMLVILFLQVLIAASGVRAAGSSLSV